jgi:type II secretory pathway component PulF
VQIFKYKVLKNDGTKKEGAILADDYRRAYETLHRKHCHPMEIKKVYFVSKKVSLDDLSMFFMHVNFQLKCGVSINDAIESFTDFHGNKTLNATLLNISDSLKNGESIGEAFEKNPSIFDSVIVGLLKSAENTGNTMEIISNILSFLKLQMDWKNNVKRVIAYPIFITVVALMVLILSVGVLGPQVISLVQNCDNGEVSALTQFTINVLPKVLQILFFLSMGLLILFWTQKGKSLLSQMILAIPKIGELSIKIFLWQFCKIMHIALYAKLDFVRALDLAIETIELPILKNELKNIRDNIADGYKISLSFSNGNLIPKEILMAIYIGEEGNSLTDSFDHISENLYKEILFSIKAMGQILSLGLTIFTGLIFIFILCSLFYPIYNYIEIAGL